MSKAIAIVSALLNLVLGFLLYRGVDDQRNEGHAVNSGTTASTISGRDLSGGHVKIQFPGPKPVVVYFFSPDCSWCERNLESVAALHRRSEGRFRFVAVSLDEDRIDEWATMKTPRFEILRRLDYRAAVAYPVEATPATILISPQGVIESVWMGPYRGDTLRGIERRLGVVLPEAGP